MATRPSWKGHLRLSLVSVPVVAFNSAAADGGKVHFRQLHEKCHTPIKYQKTCPIHGEVTKDEIVLGYEYESGHFALVEPEERAAAQGRERVMSLDSFVPLSSIDPLYFDGSSFYLLPDGKVAGQPYAVLAQALESKKVCAVGELTIGEREQLMMLRSKDGMLMLNALHYASEVKPADTFQDDIPSAIVSREELKLAETLIDVSGKKRFDLDKYEDDYNERLQQLIKDKIAGKEITVAAKEEAPKVINLMDALKKSVAQHKKGSEDESHPRIRGAARKTPASGAKKARPKRKVS